MSIDSRKKIKTVSTIYPLVGFVCWGHMCICVQVHLQRPEEAALSPTLSFSRCSLEIRSLTEPGDGLSASRTQQPSRAPLYHQDWGHKYT